MSKNTHSKILWKVCWCNDQVSQLALLVTSACSSHTHKNNEDRVFIMVCPHFVFQKFQKTSYSGVGELVTTYLILFLSFTVVTPDPVCQTTSIVFIWTSLSFSRETACEWTDTQWEALQSQTSFSINAERCLSSPLSLLDTGQSAPMHRTSAALITCYATGIT